MNKTIEIFSGGGNLTRSLKNEGFSATSFDKRRRAGTVEPDYKIDILQMSPDHSIFENALLLWFGLPCQTWSYASGNHHRNKVPGTLSKQAISAAHILNHCFQIVEKNNPVFYVFENPRGHLRYHKPMLEFLARTNGSILDFTMGSFGFSSQKPTQLFTNWQALKLPPSLPYGRGAKSSGNFQNLTVDQRQNYPVDFCSFISSSLANYKKSMSM